MWSSASWPGCGPHACPVRTRRTSCATSAQWRRVRYERRVAHRPQRTPPGVSAAPPVGRAAPVSPPTTIRFYQTGSIAVGNRLLDPAQRAVQADEGRSNAITCGHRACQGCGEALGARYALDAAVRATGGAMIRADG